MVSNICACKCEAASHVSWFGIKADWTGDITALYREKARIRHPDAGGNDTLMAELNVAYEEACRELGL